MTSSKRTGRWGKDGAFRVAARLRPAAAASGGGGRWRTVGERVRTPQRVKRGAGRREGRRHGPWMTWPVRRPGALRGLPTRSLATLAPLPTVSPRLLAALFGALLTAASASAQYLPDGAEQWYLTTDDGVRLYVVEVGQAAAPGDTVLVLHGGFGADHSYLFDAVLPLADGHRFVLYDQRGSLRSPAPDSLLSMDAMVADVEALRQDLGTERVTLLGHSMGTSLAYAYLAAHPDRVANLVLTGPVFPFAPGANPGPGLFEALDIPLADTTAMQARYQAFSDAAEARAQAVIAAEGLDDAPATGKTETARWRIMFTAYNSAHAERWRQTRGGMAFYNPDVYRALSANEGGVEGWSARYDRYDPALLAYDGPLTFVVGQDDFVDPGAEIWPRLVARYPRARLALIPDAGHTLWTDQPNAFREAVAAALDAPMP